MNMWDKKNIHYLLPRDYIACKWAKSVCLMPDGTDTVGTNEVHYSKSVLIGCHLSSLKRIEKHWNVKNMKKKEAQNMQMRIS